VLKDSTNAITSHKRYLWADGHQPAEERAANGTTIERRYHHQGEERFGGTDTGKYLYTTDHLGSIRELIDSTGTTRALYDYDPYGVRTKLSGDLDTEISFTGHPYHAAIGLHLTLFRAYDAELGRWLSADPIEEEGGLNLYAYVNNSATNDVDIYGLEPIQNHHALSFYQTYLSNHPLVKEAGANLRTDLRNQFPVENHLGRHSLSYHQKCGEMLDSAWNKYKSNGERSQVKADQALSRVYQKIQNNVYSGKLPLYDNKQVWRPVTSQTYNYGKISSLRGYQPINNGSGLPINSYSGSRCFIGGGGMRGGMGSTGGGGRPNQGISTLGRPNL
jgi:RHS repeat-associated protein